MPMSAAQSPAPNAPVFSRYRWVICALLFFATTINYVDRAVLGVLAPTLVAEFGWSQQEYGVISASFTLAYAIGFLFAGWFIDRVGTRVGYSVYLTAWSIAAAAHALAKSVVGFSLAAGVPATLVGALVTRWIDGSALMAATEVLLVAIGLRLAWSARPAAIAVRPATTDPADDWQLLAVGAVVGLAGGLLANSGGFLLAPLYLSVLRLPIKPALGTSLAVSAVLAVPATIVHASLGPIDWAVAAVLAVTALPAARLGARIGLRAAPHRLELAFGLALASLGLVTLLV